MRMQACSRSTRPDMLDMQVIARLLLGRTSASITLHISHYVSRLRRGDLRSPT